MQTKELDDVLKNAAEVTSLGAVDRLAVIDSDGKPLKVNASVVKGLSQDNIIVYRGQWLRIAKYTNANGVVGILFLSHVWVSGSASPSILIFQCSGNNGAFPINVKALYSGQDPSFNAIRCVKDGENRYIEVQFNRASTTRPIVRLLGILVDLVPFSISTASDSDVINTVSIVGGGGKSFAFNKLYNLAERRVA